MRKIKRGSREVRVPWRLTTKPPATATKPPFEDAHAAHMSALSLGSDCGQGAREVTPLRERYGVNRAEPNSILNGKRRVSGPLVITLGLRKVYIAE